MVGLHCGCGGATLALWWGHTGVVVVPGAVLVPGVVVGATLKLWWGYNGAVVGTHWAYGGNKLGFVVGPH